MNVTAIDPPEQTIASHDARAAFISSFDPEMFPNLMQFGREISNLDADVLIFTARKAACLFDAMRDVGLAETSSIVVSNRVLDMDLGWLRDKTVALVDDILITGSSIYHDAERLRAAGVTRIDVVVLAVDREYWVPALAKPTNSPVSVPNLTALNMCTQIVDALSVVPRPYNLDWPLYDGGSIPQERLSSLSSMPGWRAVDTTSNLQDLHDIFSITFEATRSVRTRLEQETGLDLSGVRLLKVRTYGAPDESGGALTVRVLPIAAWEELSVRDVGRLFDAVVQRADVDLADEFTSAQSRLRLVQFFLAARLGQIWLDDFSLIAGTIESRHLEDGQLAFAFPPHIVGHVRSVSANPVEFPPIVFQRVKPMRPAIREAAQPAASMWEAQDALASPFQEMYRTKELPARLLLKRYGPAAFDDPGLTEILDRLQRGRSLRELETHAAELLGSPLSAAAIVSSFLDAAVDQGIIVPITVEKDGVVSRCYRHGEDINFTDNEPHLFGVMLQEAFATSKRTEINKISVEKLAVLFLRIGVAENVFTRHNGRLGERGTVGVRADLHGAVIQSNATTMFGSNPGNGLGRMLLNRGTLVLKEGVSGYQFGQLPTGVPANGRAEALAEKVGIFFGELLKNGKLSTRDLVLLATCADAPTTIAALAAEIDIVSLAWNATASKVALQQHNPMDATKALEDSTSWTALRSGAAKYEAYQSGAPDQIARRIANDVGKYEARDWTTWWAGLSAAAGTATPDQRAMLKRSGAWLLSANIAASIIKLSYFIEAGKETEDLLHEIRTNSRALRRADRKAPALVLEANAHSVGPGDESLLRDNALAYMQQLLGESGPIIDEAESRGSTWGRPADFVTYTQAVHIVASGRGANDAYALITAMAAAHHASAGDRKSHFDQWSPVTDVPGVTYVGQGARSLYYVTKLATDAVKLSTSELDVRALVIARLDRPRMVFRGAGGAYNGQGLLDHIRARISDRSLEQAGAPGVVIDGDSVPPNDVAKAAGEVQRHAAERFVKRTTSPEHRDDISILISQEETLTDGDRYDIGIITIVPAEARAVRTWLEECEDYDDPYIGGVPYHTANVKVGASNLRVIMAQALDQGNVNAAGTLQDLVREFRPRLAVLLGIAGGIDEDVKLGDVVIPTLVIDYGPQAIKNKDEVEHAGQAWPADPTLRRVVTNFISSPGAAVMAGPKSRDLDKESVTIHAGAIGSGYAVIKSDTSMLRQWLRDTNRKTLAVETEGAGFLGTYDLLDKDRRPENFMIVRGISDNADPKKDDRWHDAASENAVEALRALLPGIVRALKL